VKRKLTEKEIAHRLQVAQIKADLDERVQTVCEQRWKEITKAIEKAVVSTHKGIVMLI
jgi:hypothetical protein